MDINVLVIATFFSLSLLGAYVLFKFLDSQALIDDKRYKAGGAIAGFILIYGCLFGAYYKLESNKTQFIEGTITPYTRFTKVVLAVKQTDPDTSGNFRMSANCIDLDKDDVKVYVFSEDGRPISKNIFNKDDLKGMKISMTGN